MSPIGVCGPVNALTNQISTHGLMIVSSWAKQHPLVNRAVFPSTKLAPDHHIIGFGPRTRPTRLLPQTSLLADKGSSWLIRCRLFFVDWAGVSPKG